jgi:hypothetical protein
VNANKQLRNLQHCSAELAAEEMIWEENHGGIMSMIKDSPRYNERQCVIVGCSSP